MVRATILFFKGIFDAEARSAARIAKDFVRAQHPDLGVHAAWFRAKEPERIVLAVIYDERDLRSRPSPYRLVAVARSTGDASFLETTAESPYWIRGRK